MLPRLVMCTLDETPTDTTDSLSAKEVEDWRAPPSAWVSW